MTINSIDRLTIAIFCSDEPTTIQSGGGERKGAHPEASEQSGRAEEKANSCSRRVFGVAKSSRQKDRSHQKILLPAVAKAVMKMWVVWW